MVDRDAEFGFEQRGIGLAVRIVAGFVMAAGWVAGVEGDFLFAAAAAGLVED